MRLVVVTGIEGQLGSGLLRQIGSSAVGLDLPDFDPTDRQTVLARLAENRPGVVINTAAYTRVDEAEQDRDVCRVVNSTGVAHLAGSPARIPCGKRRQSAIA